MGGVNKMMEIDNEEGFIRSADTAMDVFASINAALRIKLVERNRGPTPMGIERRRDLSATWAQGICPRLEARGGRSETGIMAGLLDATHVWVLDGSL
jgi:hypothetical protein